MDSTQIGISISLITKGFSVLSGDVKRLNALSESLKKAGRDVTELNQKISKIKSFKEKIGINQDKILGEFSHFQSRLAAVGSFGLPLKLAIDYEDAFADIKKVVDFKDEAEKEAFSNELLRLTQIIPLTAKELTQIAAAGGQMGISKDELLDFTQMVAKVATAFDMSADSAGESIGKIKNILNLDLSGTKDLMDVINGLSNSNPAKAGELVDVMKRIGAQGKQIGLTKEQTVALGSAFISLGKAPETASNAANKLMKTLGNISTSSEKEKKALAELGFDVDFIQAGMKTDSKKMMMDFLRAVKNIEDSKRGAILNTLFGDNYDTDIATLVGGLDTLEKAMNDVANPAKFKNSSDTEFQNKANTTLAALKRFRGAWTAIGIQIGNAFLPVLNTVTSFFSAVAKFISYFLKEFPRLSKVIFGIVGGFLAIVTLAPMFRILGWSIGILINQARILGTAFSFLIKVFRLKWLATLKLNLAYIAVTAQTKATAAATWIANTASKAYVFTTGILSKALTALKAGFTAAGLGAKILRIALISTGIGAIAVGIGIAAAYIIEHWDEVKAFFMGFWQKIQPYWESIAAWFEKVWSTVANFFSSVWDSAKALFSGSWDGIETRFSAAVETIKAFFSPLTDFFSDIAKSISAAFDWVIDFWKNTFGGFFDWIGEKVNWMKDMARSVKEFFGFGEDADTPQKSAINLFGQNARGELADINKTYAGQTRSAVLKTADGREVNVNFSGNFNLHSNDGKFDLQSFKSQVTRGVQDALRRDELNSQNTDVRG